MTMRHRNARPRRSGFTLLEVLLASLIAVFLLGGLYVAFDVTFRQTQEARDAVDSSHLSRAVFNKMSLDLASTLSPLPPKSGGNSSGSTSSTAATTGATDTTGATSATGTATTTTDPTATGSTDDGTIDGTTVVSADIPFQAGVIGSETQMTVFVSRVPFALGDANTFTQIVNQESTGEGMGSDLLRVTYWLSSSGTGLCRQERPWVTADGIRDNTEPDRTDEAADVIADEVKSLRFEYYDGPSSSWLPSWDGSTPGPDGLTPTGPPRAVRVTMTLEVRSSRPGEAARERSVIQVIPIRTAAGLSTPPLLDTGTPEEDTTMSTGGGM